MTSTLFKKARPFFAIFLIAVNLLSFTFSISAQQGLFSTPTPDEKTTETSAPLPTPEPTPIPFSNVITEAEATWKKLYEVQKNIDADSTVSAIEQELPELRQEIDALLPETNLQLSGRASLDALNKINREWELLKSKILKWKTDLRILGNSLDKQLAELERLIIVWEQTSNSTKQIEPNETEPSEDIQKKDVQKEDIPKEDIQKEDVPKTDIPPEIQESISKVENEIKAAQAVLQKKRNELLILQSNINEQEKRVNEIIGKVQQIRKEALSYLFVRDSPPIWSAHQIENLRDSLLLETENSFSKQFTDLREYALKYQESFFWHAIILVVLIFGFYWLRRKVRPLTKQEPKIKRAMSVFQFPIATSLVLTVLLSGWFYPQAPRLLNAILEASALIPGILILRRLMEKPMFPVLNALMIFYFVDKLRDTFAVVPFIARYLFLIQMLGVIIFLVWFLRSKKFANRIQVRHRRIFNIIRSVIPFALFVFAVAFILNAIGYISLGQIIGNGLLGSAYIALIIYAVVRIIQSLLTFAVRVYPFSLLGMVKTHRRILQDKILRIVRWIAAIIWFILTLDVLLLRETIFNYVGNIIRAELIIGSIQLSLGDIFAFVFTVWLALTLSRLIRFVLKEEIYPRVNLIDGVSYAISTILHYSVLLIGFFIAIAALGIDLSKFTILAGAFGVGLGFGLQNIVNNFVSGLILLFERPIKVGDVLQLRETQGDLKRIGLRASVLKTLDGSEIIVPNGQLISEEVVNWTFSDRKRRIQVDVGVAYGNDPERIIELLTKVAEEHPDIVKDPPPRTLFMEFGDSSLDFQLRAWTTVASKWMRIKSDLAVGIYKTLNKEEIEIPFPQRDLHLRTVPKQLSENIEIPPNDDDKNN